jgi:hypothetical protein|tara:strand:- start:8083 stop:8931 length:849 start_codon:yes stop_codon:yes gene_type:complete
MKTLVDAGPSTRGWHQFEMAARCMRWWGLNKVDGRKWPLSAPLVKGSLLHSGLANYYQRIADGDNADSYYTALEAVSVLAQQESDKAEDGNEASLWLSSVPVIHSALLDYVERYKDCSWEVVAVEQELRADIPRREDDIGEGDTFLYTQRADLIIRDAQGFGWIVDHKSAYRITTHTLRQYCLSGQFLGYQIFGRKMFGAKFGGIILNRVKLVAPHEFDRCAIEPAPQAVADFVGTLKDIEARVSQYSHLKKGMDFTPVLSEQTCYGKYGACPAYELCRWGE